MARVAAIALGLGLWIASGPAMAAPRVIEARVAVDLDDDDADGVPDADQARVSDGTDCASWDVSTLPAALKVLSISPAGAARALADGEPIAQGQTLPAGARKLMIQALRPGAFVVDLGAVQVRGKAIAILAIDGDGKLVSLATSHASFQRTVPDRVSTGGAQREADALRYVVAGETSELPAVLSIRSRSEAGTELSSLAALALAEVPCPAALGNGIVCKATVPVRVAGDDVDRMHPLVADRSLVGELGGGLLIDAGHGRRQQIRVGGPRETRFGPMKRYRATLRPRLMRVTARGAPPLGGTEKGAIALVREQIAHASSLWAQCGISFGSPAEADVALVDPPPPWMVAVGCELGTPASGGEVRLVVDGRPVTVRTRAGWSPSEAARAIGAELGKKGFRVLTSPNARIGPGAMPSVDLEVWRKQGGAAVVQGPKGPVSTDPTLGVCVGRADLSSGLRHFLDVDSMAGTFDERMLLKWVDDHDPATIDLLVISAFARGGRIGESFIGTDRSSLRNALIIDRSGVRVARASYTLAHEVGHVFLDVPGHPDDFGWDTPTLLMDSDGADLTAFGPRRLPVSDCERAWVHAGSGAAVPLLRAWPWGRLSKP